MAPALTPPQQAVYHEDRRPELYAGLIVLLLLNNIVVAARLIANYVERYRDARFGFHLHSVLVEDSLALLSALFINVMIGNLLASTHYGLGLHSWRINLEDANYPSNLSNAFKHVWITMVFTAPTFTWIKLTLLFFYRRLFLVSQKWLRLAWWANMVYVGLWLVGATGFYLFQCWPVQWYFMRYYSRYHRPSPYPISGQCRATNVTNVSRPLIFGLVSDVAILLLPLFAISRLQMSRGKKLALCGLFSIGVVACGLDMARIIELSTDTDDIVDPSYGVVIFLLLSVATAVAALACACLPIIMPAIYKAYRRRCKHDCPQASPYPYPTPSSSEPESQRQKKSRGFAMLWDEAALLETANPPAGKEESAVELTEVRAPERCLGQGRDVETYEELGQQGIWIERSVEVQVEPARGRGVG